MIFVYLITLKNKYQYITLYTENIVNLNIKNITKISIIREEEWKKNGLANGVSSKF